MEEKKKKRTLTPIIHFTQKFEKAQRPKHEIWNCKTSEENGENPHNFGISKDFSLDRTQKALTTQKI